MNTTEMLKEIEKLEREIAFMAKYDVLIGEKAAALILWYKSYVAALKSEVAEDKKAA